MANVHGPRCRSQRPLRPGYDTTLLLLLNQPHKGPSSASLALKFSTGAQDQPSSVVLRAKHPHSGPSKTLARAPSIRRRKTGQSNFFLCQYVMYCTAWMLSAFLAHMPYRTIGAGALAFPFFFNERLPLPCHPLGLLPMYESPRFLLSSGLPGDAKDILLSIHSTNVGPGTTYLPLGFELVDEGSSLDLEVCPGPGHHSCLLLCMTLIRNGCVAERIAAAGED